MVVSRRSGENSELVAAILTLARATGNVGKRADCRCARAVIRVAAMNIPRGKKSEKIGRAYHFWLRAILASDLDLPALVRELKL